jgi:hypothetical protein
MVIGLAAVVVVAGLPLELSYFTSRLDFSGTVMNLSNLVYLQGWEMALESLSRSHGWGVGFQQLGLHGTDVPAAALIRIIMLGDDTNLTDGSFVFSKLVSEFGVIGIVLGIIYVIGATGCVLALRTKKGRCGTTLARCIVVSYGVDMFVRGPGYFVQSTLLFIAAMAVLVSDTPSIFHWALKSHLRLAPAAPKHHATEKSL